MGDGGKPLSKSVPAQRACRATEPLVFEASGARVESEVQQWKSRLCSQGGSGPRGHRTSGPRTPCTPESTSLPASSTKLPPGLGHREAAIGFRGKVPLFMASGVLPVLGSLLMRVPHDLRRCAQCRRTWLGQGGCYHQRAELDKGEVEWVWHRLH